MKIAAVIIGCHQVSPEDYQTDRRVYVFDSSQSLDEIMQATGTNREVSRRARRARSEGKGLQGGMIMGQLASLPGTNGKPRDVCFFYSITKALKLLTRDKCATTSGDLGAINIWIDDSGLYRGCRMAWMNIVSETTVNTKVALKKWLIQELPLIKAPKDESAKPWRLELLCCGHHWAIERYATWAQADNARQDWEKSASVDHPDRRGIVTESAKEGS